LLDQITLTVIMTRMFVKPIAKTECMMDKTKLLKVKIKSLAAEAQIIRLEERRAKQSKQYTLLNELHNHRVGPVRAEARAALMAYGMIRGKTHDQIEPRSESLLGEDYFNTKLVFLDDKEKNHRTRVAQLLKKYGPIRERSLAVA